MEGVGAVKMTDRENERAARQREIWGVTERERELDKKSSGRNFKREQGSKSRRNGRVLSVQTLSRP